MVNGPQRQRHEPDYLLMVVAAALSAIGILMVYSSSGHDAALYGDSVFDAITEQLGWALLGGLVLFVVMRVDYRYWRSFSILGMFVALVLLVLVIGPGSRRCSSPSTPTAPRAGCASAGCPRSSPPRWPRSRWSSSWPTG